LRQQLSDARNVIGLSLDDELVALCPNSNVEHRFEVAEVFVVGPDKGLESGLGDRNLPERNGWNSRISLCYSYLPEAMVANDMPAVK
jgi:hypothetical protein